MLDTGFEPDIRKLEDLGLPPKDERFTSMFSATFPDEVQKLARHFLRENYIFLAVGTPGGANEDIAQTIEEVPQANKKDRLFQLLDQNLSMKTKFFLFKIHFFSRLESERCLIFVETKRSADYIGALLSQKKLMSTTMHGDRSQKQRYEAVQQFTNGKCPILVATSVAARGLDFPLIGYVVNYDLPDSSDFYIHRIGRTGRAGHLGKSISFFDPDRDSDRKIAPELIAKLTEV
jgi:probable ATP-dependent RNA helicase DDX4